MQIFPIPVLFSHGLLFPNQILFGLIVRDASGKTGIQPVRVVASDKVRPLFGNRPEALPDTLDILAVNDHCMQVLEAAGMLEGMLLLMAQDMYNAVSTRIKRKRKRKPYADTPQGRAAARRAAFRRLGIHHD